MAVRQLQPQLFVLEQMEVQQNRCRRVLESQASPDIVSFVEKWAHIDDVEKLLVLETGAASHRFGLEPDSEVMDLGYVINLKRLNDIRYVNKYLESVNEKMSKGGILIGCLETSAKRWKDIMSKYPKPINKVFYFFDYLFKRVVPKLPYLKRAYFALTQGRNRVISEMETYGRLYSCGFRFLDAKEIDGKLYFAAEKTGTPDYNTEATYGPLIKLRRVGKNGKLVKVYKFRTMYPYSEYVQQFIYERNGLGDGAKFKDDPRVTALGSFLRKYWLDELPMIFNWLRGDVKLFGVRPISRHYFSLYPQEFQEFRSKFKPGLIPPVYVEIPKCIEDTIDIERRYLQAYERQPLLTDLRYTFKAFYNIAIKMVRSR